MMEHTKHVIKQPNVRYGINILDKSVVYYTEGKDGSLGDEEWSVDRVTQRKASNFHALDEDMFGETLEALSDLVSGYRVTQNYGRLMKCFGRWMDGWKDREEEKSPPENVEESDELVSILPFSPRIRVKVYCSSFRNRFMDLVGKQIVWKDVLQRYKLIYDHIRDLVCDYRFHFPPQITIMKFPKYKNYYSSSKKLIEFCEFWKHQCENIHSFIVELSKYLYFKYAYRDHPQIMSKRLELVDMFISEPFISLREEEEFRKETFKQQKLHFLWNQIIIPYIDKQNLFLVCQYLRYCLQWKNIDWNHWITWLQKKPVITKDERKDLQNHLKDTVDNQRYQAISSES